MTSSMNGRPHHEIVRYVRAAAATSGPGPNAPTTGPSSGSPTSSRRPEITTDSHIPSNPALTAPRMSPVPMRFATRGVVA